MGRYDEVLTAVEALRPKMDALPLESEADGTANPLERARDVARHRPQAACDSERWETALTLNAEVVKVMKARGANALEWPASASTLPVRCSVWAATTTPAPCCRAAGPCSRPSVTSRCWARSTAPWPTWKSATGGRAEAVRFEEVALGYRYQAGEPEDCAISHNNLASYLERQGADPATVLAHRLAAAAIRLQTQVRPTVYHGAQSGELRPAPHPPTFADVVGRVEAIEGVRFRALFERLPRTAPDGDAALAAVWQMVADEKRRRDEIKQRLDAVLAAAPAAVRAAFELEGDALRGAGGAARGGSRRPEAAPAEAGLIQVSAGPDMTQVLQSSSRCCKASPPR